MHIPIVWLDSGKLVLIFPLFFLLLCKARKSMSCTLMPCSWLSPSFKNVRFTPISYIDFSAPEIKLKTSIGNSIATTSSRSDRSMDWSGLNNNIIIPFSNELNVCFKKLSEAGKPVVLSLIPENSNAYIPLYEQGTLPKLPSDYYDDKYLKLSYPIFWNNVRNFATS